jgi:hypothetical protein
MTHHYLQIREQEIEAWFARVFVMQAAFIACDWVQSEYNIRSAAQTEC